ncbi:flagellar brake protein [Clostridium akagii]|uniref:flagellar brake protein n=1 Tax=Clostridium akagii TaxID=91623 RepID=UPI00047B187F|nr:flagellar brake domain-containing protein [Clostridium akagii]
MNIGNFGINLNTKCEILIKGRPFKSNIQDVSEKFIFISIPVFNGNYANLIENEEIEVIYYDENNVYGFKSKVVGKKNEKIAMIAIEIPDEIKKVQRRNFFRIDLSVSVEYKKISSNLTNSELNKIIQDEKDFDKAIMVDLSGGGIRLRTKNDIEQNDLVIVKIPINGEKICMTCNCIRVIKDTVTKSNICGFSFYSAEDAQIDKIISYIFQLMRELRKKS